jgi:hypothetical protein
MTIFAILMPIPQPRLAEAIKSKFEKDHLAITDTQWLISATTTVTDLATTLGIYDAKEPNKPATGNAVIFAVSSYFGRAPATVWDWLKLKLEAPSSG